MRISWRDAGLFLLIYACWITCSVGQLMKYFHSAAVVLILAGAIAIALVLALARRMQLRSAGSLHWGWFAAYLGLLTALYLVLYPIANQHIVGVGSDRENALVVADRQMVHLEYPYSVPSYLGNPISVLPGGLMLALPFYLMGRVSIQNILWLAALVVFCVKFFRQRTTAMAYLVVLILGSAGVLDDIVGGGDLAINTIYVCIGICVFLWTFDKNPNGWQHYAVGVFLGFALSSRVIFIVIPPLLLAYLLQHGKRSAAIKSIAVPTIVALGVTLPFYLYDPAGFSPLEVAHKLDNTGLPAEIIQPLVVILPVLGILAACAGFFVRLTIARVNLIAGLAVATIAFPPIGVFQLLGGDAEYLSYNQISSVFLMLWALDLFERAQSRS
jgi:hypothetical protein